jgi:hypothetical protein
MDKDLQIKKGEDVEDDKVETKLKGSRNKKRKGGSYKDIKVEKKDESVKKERTGKRTAMVDKAMEILHSIEDKSSQEYEVPQGTLDTDKPVSNLGLNGGIVSNDFSWSLKHLLIVNSKIERKRWKFNLFISPEFHELFYSFEDIYLGAKQDNALEQWSLRLQLAVDIFLEQICLWMKRGYGTVTFGTKQVTALTDAFEQLTYEEGEAIFKKLNTVNIVRPWRVQRNTFYKNDTVSQLIPISYGQSYLKLRRATTYWNQAIFKGDAFNTDMQEYVKSCIANMYTVSLELGTQHIAGNIFSFVLNDKDLKNDQLALRHPVQRSNTTALFTYLSSKIPTIRYMIFAKIKAIADAVIKVSTSSGQTNTTLLANNMQLNLTSVASVNAIPTTVFSTDASSIFSTMVAGCCMNQCFEYVAIPNSNGGFDVDTIYKMFCYLIYCPAQLFSVSTLDSIRDFLWIKVLQAYKWDNNSTSANFSYDGINVIHSLSMLGGTRNRPLNSVAQDWITYRVQSTGADPISRFFRYPFVKAAVTRANNVLFEGNNYMGRMETCINFLRALTSYQVYNNYITNIQRGQMINIATILQSQVNAYYEYAKYMTNIVQYIVALGLTNFASALPLIGMDINPTAFFALTMKMSHFTAEYTSEFYNVSAWADAVKAEIGICINVFDFFWDRNNYWFKYLQNNKPGLRQFLSPIVGKMKILMTTDLSKYVWDTLWDVVKNEQLPDTIKNFDVFKVRDGMIEILKTVEAQEDLCGYNDSVMLYPPLEVVKPAGFDYILTGTQSNLPIYPRDVALNRSGVYGSCVIKTETEKYKCFQTVPTEHSNKGLVDDTKLREELSTSTKKLDIPMYYGWAFNAPVYQEPLLTRPPSMIPLPTNNNLFKVTVTDINDEDDLTFISQSPDDFIYIDNSGIANNFVTTRLYK